MTLVSKKDQEYQVIRYYYNNLRYYRLRQHLTLRQLADRTQLSVSYISRMESGNTPLSPRVLEKLSRVLECDPEQLSKSSLPYH